MTEYIDRSEIRWNPTPRSEREYQTFSLDDAYEQGYDDAFDQVEAIKPADVQERKRGKWLELFDHRYSCSKCDYVNDDDTNFCPNCGAKMVNNNE